jgi:hypothetical protein
MVAGAVVVVAAFIGFSRQQFSTSTEQRQSTFAAPT